MNDQPNKEENTSDLFKEIDHREKVEIDLNQSKADEPSNLDTDDHNSLNNHSVKKMDNQPLTDWDQFDTSNQHSEKDTNDDSKKKKSLSREILEYVIIFAITILAVNFIHNNVFTPVSVEGESMEPTLHDQDYLFLWELGDIDRFDVIVFKATKDDYYVKRVIGMPGDSIRYKNNQLYINNQYYEEDYFTNGVKQPTESFNSSDVCRITNFPNNISCENGVIPEGYYLVLGDNRTNSTDSRRIGLVKEESILGKTKFILYPFDRIGSIE
ncbi:signal peptidase I [Haloplasma contractile]|uniref:Signal peptidase I n=1 Tax=Haloplasma contractile SSD-17B TaxID=1033810 RepID=U2DZ42_9MOLU|nr:signal peptidase I [Haloplasma contractile]ERJ13497.1 Signal peptidase I protein [Haloplasma contractile SSD-17B]